MTSIRKGQYTSTKMRIFTTAVPGCEGWTVKETDVKKINAFTMKCYRKILRIPVPWKEKLQKCADENWHQSNNTSTEHKET